MALNRGRTGSGKDRSSDMSIDITVATVGGERDVFFLGTILVTLGKVCGIRLLRLRSAVSAESLVTKWSVGCWGSMVGDTVWEAAVWEVAGIGCSAFS